jgi:hypothetical protein
VFVVLGLFAGAASHRRGLRGGRAATRRARRPARFRRQADVGILQAHDPPSLGTGARGDRRAIQLRVFRPRGLRSRYRERIHKGYYVEDTDTTALETFVAYAEQEGIDGAAFAKAFESDAMKQETLGDFHWCQQIGVTGFPTVLLREDDKLAALTIGYQPFERLQPALDAWTGGELSLHRLEPNETR